MEIDMHKLATKYDKIFQLNLNNVANQLFKVLSTGTNTYPQPWPNTDQWPCRCISEPIIIGQS